MDLISLADLSAGDLAELFLTARDLWRHPTGFEEACRRRTAVLLVGGNGGFAARLAVDVGFSELGGRIRTYAIDDLGPEWVARPADLARLLAPAADGVVVIGPADLARGLRDAARVPVVAAATTEHATVDALALLMASVRTIGSLAGRHLAFLGDGGPLAHGLLVGGALAGMTVAVAHPRGYAPDPTVVTAARDIAARHGGAILVTSDPEHALTDADVVVIDRWCSPEEDQDLRREHFAGFTLTPERFALARPGAPVFHPGPITSPEEVSESLLADGTVAIGAWAHDRIHVTKAVLLHAFGRRRRACRVTG